MRILAPSHQRSLRMQSISIRLPERYFALIIGWKKSIGPKPTIGFLSIQNSQPPETIFSPVYTMACCYVFPRRTVPSSIDIRLAIMGAYRWYQGEKYLFPEMSY